MTWERRRGRGRVVLGDQDGLGDKRFAGAVGGAAVVGFECLVVVQALEKLVGKGHCGKDERQEYLIKGEGKGGKNE